MELHPLKYAEKVSTLLLCPTEPRVEMINCLRNQSQDALIKSQKDLIDFWIYPKHGVPVVDGTSRGPLAVLPENPSLLLDTGKIFPLPMIIGVTQDEGLFGLAKIYEFFGNEKFRDTSFFTSEILARVIRALLKIEKDEDIQYLLDLVQENYFKNVNMTDGVSLAATITEMSEVSLSNHSS